MTNDPTETIRREMILDGRPLADLALARSRWTTEELTRDFIVHSFAAPFAVVTRKCDGAHGSIEFTHSPRFYFNFVEGRS